MSIDPKLVRQSIENLKLTHPELLEDNEAWLATLESETSFEELLTSVVRRIEDTKALVIGTKDRFEELKARKDRFEHTASRRCASAVQDDADRRTRQRSNYQRPHYHFAPARNSCSNAEPEELPDALLQDLPQR
jgi:sugar-specific transcriptional regulator TrmB